MILAKTCHSSCTECFGSASSQCYSCISSSFLSGNTCSAGCLAGYGQVTGSNICILCDLRCTACSINSTYCSACQSIAPNNAFLYLSTCVNPCPNGTFANTATRTCDPCVSKCVVCSDSLSCTTCLAGYTLRSGLCDSNCPQGKY